MEKGKAAKRPRTRATTAAAAAADPSVSAPRRPGLYSGFVDFGASTTGATVVRLNREASKSDEPFSATGMRIASSRDFEKSTVPPDLDGADMIVFERFGIGIVDSDPDRLNAAIAKGVSERTVLGHRAERIFHALGTEMVDPPRGEQRSRGFGLISDHLSALPGGVGMTREFLMGYLGGVQGLVAHLLGEQGGPPIGGLFPASGFDPAVSGLNENLFTWGLQATSVPGTRATGRGIRLAVLDTGIDLLHPDFAGRHIVAKSFVPGQDVQDGNGHGTHCAGTACGPLKPAAGPRYGIAHDAELYVGKVLSDAGSGSDRTVIAGLEWALNSECDVISMSLGAAVDEGAPFLDDYELIGADALNSGSLIVAAAGNESNRPGFIAPVGSPANCPSIFSVAAIDKNLRVAPFSCGKRGEAQGGEVDISAPGDDVYSSYPQPRGYARLRGTSMAAPHVAGIAALFAELDRSHRGLGLWGALIQGRRFLRGEVADIGAGLAQAPSP